MPACLSLCVFQPVGVLSFFSYGSFGETPPPAAISMFLTSIRSRRYIPVVMGGPDFKRFGWAIR